MRTSKEEWGSWTDRSLSWDRQKEISLSFKEGTTPEQMVIAAIGIAKSHKFTYKYFYEDGIGQHHNSETVTEKDIARYKDHFGTDKCIHRDFKKKFWYSSNWNGETREFHSLKKAKEAAAKEIGMTVWIYTNFPYGRPSEIVFKAEASGITPP